MIYLTNFEQKTRNFYGLPKIHKNKQKTIKKTWTTSTSNYVDYNTPGNLTFRPIVAGPTCETHRLSNLIDILLQSYTKCIKSYVNDTKYILHKLPHQLSKDSILVSFDVESSP